ncbi:MAG: L-lactate permease, partial [Thermoguttaceae bacterium]|nr:L-lactate permease [Thermoguttaceae bacterium]
TLVDVGAGLTSLVATTLLLKVWQPAEVWQFEGEEEPAEDVADRKEFTRREIISAWLPWVILIACIFVWGSPHFRVFLDGGLGTAAMSARSSAEPLGWWEKPNFLAGCTERKVEVPHLHQLVYRDVPAVARREKAEDAVFRFNWLSATGTSIFAAAILSAAWMGIGPRRFARVFAATVVRMRWPIFTIGTMLAIAFTTRFSGTDVTLGLAFTRTGVLYPFFAAMLGWLGVALTGSDTSSNALFGSLQKVTAEQLGLNPVLITTANSTGGVMGKMIDAQSIVVSAAATNQPGQEGEILRFVFWHSILLASLMGLLVLLQAYVLTWMVP